MQPNGPIYLLACVKELQNIDPTNHGILAGVMVEILSMEIEK